MENQTTTTTKTNTGFIAQFMAFVKGDDAEMLAIKVAKKAKAALNTSLSAAKYDLGSKEDTVEGAEEAVANALINNGEAITNRDTYVRNYIEAVNQLQERTEELENHKELIATLEKALTNFK